MNKTFRRVCDNCHDAYPGHVGMSSGTDIVLGDTKPLYMCQGCVKGRHMLYAYEDPLYTWYLQDRKIRFVKIHICS